MPRKKKDTEISLGQDKCTVQLMAMNIKESDCRLDTDYVQTRCDPATGAVVPPLHFATTYERDENGELSRGYVYSRTGNPTRQQLEEMLTRLENGLESFAFSSGMQASTSLLMSCPGCHVILPNDLYHGVHQIAHEIFSMWGLTLERIDMTNHTLVECSLQAASRQSEKPVVVWLETPSNPQCKISDIRFVSDLAKSIIGVERTVVVVDSTWATPYLQNPLALGADFVLHSLTKYICGHSDVLGGSVTASCTTGYAAAVLSRLRTVQRVGGGVLGPWESWMALRGLRTLPVRMKQHCANAMELATRLEAHPCIERVFYPGLASHPQRSLASEQLQGRFGGMMSVLVRQAEGCSDSDKEALAVVRKVIFFKKATSLGGTESLIEHRRSVEGAYPISPPNLLRLSIGLEDVEDLFTDLDNALRLGCSFVFVKECYDKRRDEREADAICSFNRYLFAHILRLAPL